MDRFTLELMASQAQETALRCRKTWNLAAAGETTWNLAAAGETCVNAYMALQSADLLCEALVGLLAGFDNGPDRGTPAPLPVVAHEEGGAVLTHRAA